MELIHRMRGVMQAVKPLFIEYKKPSKGSVSMLFEDFPILGYNAKIRQSLVRQMKRRESFWFSSEMPNLWKNDEAAAIASGISHIIASECNWPNTLFIPDDLIHLLLWGPRGDMEAAEALLGISRKFNIPVCSLPFTAADTLGDVVSAISKYTRNH